MKKSCYYLYIFAFFFVVALDRITKWWALLHLVHGDRDVLPGLRLSLTFNRGISWSLLSFDSAHYFWLVSAIIILVILLFVGYAVRAALRGVNVAAEVMVIAGASSNILDRFLYGGVIDFIECYVGSWSWPTFNIADVFIVTGVVYLLVRNALYGWDHESS